ncbi:uncharacterized protein At5g41620-like [Arachis stenosperma]|uniref:uncharacterized protein At5g41620-like n=1 Tax=Arachis stenosperma TaxID=217475 RepID=UPI0025AC2029|nr:uncharacterized protein At5g41620-like [Arachis stenosperma]
MLLSSCTVKYFKTKSVEREMERGREEKREEGIMVFVDKRGGSSTPPPLWRLHLPSHHSRINIREFLNCPTSSSLSARELCAQLWETQPYQMALLPRCRRKGNTLLKLPKHFADSPYHQPKLERNSKRHVQASPLKHRRSVESKGCAPLPVSPASYCNSVKVAPYNLSVNPTSSAELRGKCGDPKTSRELLKVLSRISSLEEQNASSMSVIKALKMELDLSQVQVRDLLQEKRMIMRQIEEDKLVRKNKEHEKVKATVQSMNEEIEEERRLRQHSESVGQKLTRELSEMKSSLSSCLRDLEREQKGRILLENLCDDFAKGIRDYEREARSLRQNNGAETGHFKGENNLDRLMLHISEAWLDERKQSGGRDSVVDKLGVDIETFLHAKRSVDSGRCSSHTPKEIHPCLHSLDNAAMRKQVQSEDCELATQAQKHVGSSSISSEGDKVYPETDNIFGEGSVIKLSDMSESCSSSKLPKGVNDNSLMAKLLEARLQPHKPSM